jgi:hypothetical protein
VVCPPLPAAPPDDPHGQCAKNYLKSKNDREHHALAVSEMLYLHRDQNCAHKGRKKNKWKLDVEFFYKPVKSRVRDFLEPIPVGEAVDTDWAVWAETVGFEDSQPMDFQMTDKQTIAPIEGEFVDVFASVTKKSL